MAELGAIAVERVGLGAEGPGELVGRLAILDACIVGHVDRFGDRAGDEALRCRHHADVALNREEALALLAARVGAVEHHVVLFLEVRRALQRHGSADVIVRGLNLIAAEAEMLEKVKGRIVQLRLGDAEHVLAEFCAERPLVEDEADVERRCERPLNLRDFFGAKALPDQRGVVDARRVAERAVAHGVGHDLFDLRLAVAQMAQGRRHGAVDDLKVATACELFELHQGKVGLDAGRVAIHHQTDGASRSNHGDLSVAVAKFLTPGEGLVPGIFRQLAECLDRVVGVVEGHGLHRKAFIGPRLTIGGATVVADDAQHLLGIFLVTRERADLARYLSGGGVGHASHHGRQGTTERATLIGVVPITKIHQQAADVGVA